MCFSLFTSYQVQSIFGIDLTDVHLFHCVHLGIRPVETADTVQSVHFSKKPKEKQVSGRYKQK